MHGGRQAWVSPLVVVCARTLLTVRVDAPNAGVVRVRHHERAVGVGADAPWCVEHGNLAVPIPEARLALPARKHLQTAYGTEERR